MSLEIIEELDSNLEELGKEFYTSSNTLYREVIKSSMNQLTNIRHTFRKNKLVSYIPRYAGEKGIAVPTSAWSSYNKVPEESGENRYIPTIPLAPFMEKALAAKRERHIQELISYAPSAITSLAGYSLWMLVKTQTKRENALQVRTKATHDEVEFLAENYFQDIKYHH